MVRGVFVTGTGTGVGKTFVACGLARALAMRGHDVGVLKPVATSSRSDIRQLLASSQIHSNKKQTVARLEDVNPIFFREPLAPWVAAQRKTAALSITKIKSAFQKIAEQHEFVIVEGIGGVMVPLTRNYFVLDLIKDLALPALVTADAGLGTINHTLLTVNALHQRKIKIIGIVLNGWQGKSIAEHTNPNAIQELTGIKTTVLPWKPKTRHNVNKIAGVLRKTGVLEWLYE